MTVTSGGNRNFVMDSKLGDATMMKVNPSSGKDGFVILINREGTWASILDLVMP